MRGGVEGRNSDILQGEATGWDFDMYTPRRFPCGVSDVRLCGREDDIGWFRVNARNVFLTRCRTESQPDTKIFGILVTPASKRTV